MSARARLQLQSRILAALHRASRQGAASWIRFVAQSEARDLGGTPMDAEVVLQRFYRDGYLSLDFGFERGHLTPQGIAAAQGHGATLLSA